MMTGFISPKIVPKEWGCEIWLVNNSLYCGKILQFNRGFKTSLHHHRIKTESFYVLYGLIGFECPKGERFLLKPGSVFHVDPFTNHRFYVLQSANMLEISTHHSEDDSYRETYSGKMDESDWELWEGAV